MFALFLRAKIEICTLNLSNLLVHGRWKFKISSINHEIFCTLCSVHCNAELLKQFRLGSRYRGPPMYGKWCLLSFLLGFSNWAILGYHFSNTGCRLSKREIQDYKVPTRAQSLQPLKFSGWGLFSSRYLFCLRSISKFCHITWWHWCCM